MKQKYRDYVNSQHAPADLIEMTKKKMQDEEKIQKHKSLSIKVISLAAAVCIISLGTLLFAKLSFKVDDINLDKSQVDLAEDSNFKRTVSIVEYDKLMNSNFNKIDNLKNMKIDSTEAEVYYSEDGISIDNDNEIINDKCKIVFKDNNKKVTLTLSKNENIAPNELINSTSINIGGIEVHIAYDKSNKRYLGYFEKNKFYYYMETDNVTKNEIKKVIEELISHE